MDLRTINVLTCLGVFLIQCSVTSAQTCNPANPPTLDCVRAEIEDYVANFDWGKEFNDITGMSIGGAITLLIVIIIVPNLIILGLIFMCCYCCRCGAFYRLRDEDDSPYRVATMNIPSPAPNGGGYKPPVPPKPQSDAPWNAANSQKSIWPWNRNGSRSQTPNEGNRTQW